MSTESERIRSVYKQYQQGEAERIWHEPSPGNLFLAEGLKKGLRNALEREGVHLGTLKILEVGCGNGFILRYLVELGAHENSVYGIDLLEERIRAAQENLPSGHFQCADAADLPYPNESFDLVLQFTMISSILDPQIRRKITREMTRVLRPGGIIISFDTRYPNPGNPNTRSLTRRELASYFEGFQVKCESVTLIPQWARFLAKFSVGLCRFLEKIPPLRSHYLALLRKEGEGQRG